MFLGILLILLVFLCVNAYKSKKTKGLKGKYDDEKKTYEIDELYNGGKIESKYKIICDEGDFSSSEIKEFKTKLDVHVNDTILDGEEVDLYENSISVSFSKKGKEKYTASNECCYVIPTEYKGKRISTVGSIECDSAKEIYFPDGIQILEGGIVGENVETIYFPSSIHFLPFTEISCPNLKKIVFADGMEASYVPYFSGCKTIEEIVLPECMKYIGNFGVEDCVSLKKIVMPLGLEYISEGSFSGCPELTLFVGRDSYAEKYAKEHNIKYEIRE